MVHELKTWTEHFDAIVSGAKRFEIRFNDREFQVGDTLILQEYNHQTKTYTGKSIRVHVTHMLAGYRWGLRFGYVIMSINIEGGAK